MEVSHEEGADRKHQKTDSGPTTAKYFAFFDGSCSDNQGQNKGSKIPSAPNMPQQYHKYFLQYICF